MNKLSIIKEEIKKKLEKLETNSLGSLADDRIEKYEQGYHDGLDSLLEFIIKLEVK
jgi:hypothetical protein